MLIENFTMFLSHIAKTIEYFSVEGFPEISVADVSTLFNYVMKLAYIYITNLDKIL